MSVQAELAGIQNHNQMVGVVVLALKDKKCWIFHLVIDAKYQNKGIGSMAVAVLKTHIQDTWPECESIKITVHPENVVAKGFIDTGDVENSETIMEYKLKGLSN